MTTPITSFKTPVLDEQLWRVWVEKNEKRDKIKLERVIGALARWKEVLYGITVNCEYDNRSG